MKRIWNMLYIYFLGSYSCVLLSMVNPQHPLQTVELVHYRPRNSAAIMISHYHEATQSVRSFSDITRYQRMRFSRLEEAILPACMQELQRNPEQQNFRVLFKNMLVHEVHKILPLLTCLADKFADPAPETPEFLQEENALQRKLKIHEQEINQILNSKEMNCDQLMVHCMQKAYIYNALSSLQLSRYRKPPQ